MKINYKHILGNYPQKALFKKIIISSKTHIKINLYTIPHP